MNASKFDKARLAHYKARKYVLLDKLNQDPDMDRFLSLTNDLNAIEIKIECIENQISYKERDNSTVSKVAKANQIRGFRVQAHAQKFFS